MKKSKIWLPILSVAGVAATVTPLVCMTSCNSAIEIKLVDQNAQFCVTGTFEKGSKYKFVINLANWTSGKPSQGEWMNKKFDLIFTSDDSTQQNFIDYLNASAKLNGNTLNINGQSAAPGKISFTFNEGKIDSYDGNIDFVVTCNDKFTGKIQFKAQ